LGNEGIAWIYELETSLLSALIPKNSTYYKKNTESKIINIANSKTFKKRLLAVEDAILIRYDYQTEPTRALYESEDGLTGRPADNLPN